MWGSATFTTVASSTSMSWARSTTKIPAAALPALGGRSVGAVFGAREITVEDIWGSSCSGQRGRRRLVPEDSSGYIQNDTETVSGLQAAFPSPLLFLPLRGSTVLAGQGREGGPSDVCRPQPEL